MPRLALTGGAYQSRSVIASAQRCLNLVPEPMPQAQGEPGPAAHYPTPGLRLLGSVGAGPIRGIKQSTTGSVYVASGNGIYKVNPTSWAGTSLGTLLGVGSTPVSMQDNSRTLVVVDGSSNGYTIDLGSDAFATISDPAFYGADRVDYLDTYLIFNKPGTPQFYISGSLALTFDSTDFANKEIFSDLLVTLIVAKREIYLLGERTTEIWYDAGATDTSGAQFQFAPVQSVFIDHGCRAKYSVATYDDAVYWLSYDRAGQGIVLSGAGYQTKRVSTYAIEAHLATLSRIDDAIGFCYSLQGHAFYVLTLPTADETWVYDITTSHWHEWKWIDINGLEHRHRANCAYPINGVVVVGDHTNGNLYALDPDTHTDNGQPIKRQRSFPHLLNDGKRVFHRQFLADLDTGNPLPPPTVVTTVTETLTWPPEIASLSDPANVGGSLQAVILDWPRGIIYYAGFTGYLKYQAQVVTQAPASAFPFGTNLWTFGADVDPQTGNIITQRNISTSNLTNGQAILKIDQNSFALLGQFGVVTSFPSYPTSVWAGEALVCVVCNGVTYALLKYSEFSGVVAVIRVDTMTQAGFAQGVVSGSTDNRGTLCRGASGGATATVFAIGNNGSWPSIPLMVITITAGAETYDPSTWPTTNPHIAASTVGTVTATGIDSTWTNMSVNSLGYDLADGNVLLHVSTLDAVAQKYYVIKVRATDASLLWRVAVSGNVHLDLERSRINGSLWVYDPSISQRIDTLTGAVVTQAFSGVSVQGGTTSNYSATDNESALAFFYGNFTIGGANSPIPVSGTSTGYNSFWIMGGQTEHTTTTVSGETSYQIFLDWSDDRGHSYGNPVGQSIGLGGEYLKSLQWQRLGYARDRVFRLTWSVPVATALQGAWINVTPADANT